MKLPPSSEQQALRGAERQGGRSVDALVEAARAGVVDWVRVMVEETAVELASSTQRHVVAGDRHQTAPALELLQGRRTALVAQLVQALQQQLFATPAAPAVAPRNGRLTLTLIDESQIDEEIETARIVQAVESEADWELRQLRALASGLAGLPAIDDGVAPLSPLVCANGLRAGLAALDLEPATRLFLMRVLGPAMGRAIKPAYARLGELMLGWGVQPAPYRLKAGAAGAAGPAGVPGVPGASPARASLAAQALDGGPPTSAALWRMVERAHAALALAAPTAALPAEDEAAPALRLFDEPLPAGRAARALDAASAVALMERLFVQIERHLGASPGTRRLLADLQQPARELAATDTALWQRPDHPWWRMLDRLITVGTVHDDDGPVTASLAQVVERVRQAPSLDLDTCTAAADALDEVATRQHETCHSQLGDAAAPVQDAVDREEVELELRNQVVQQLRSTPVCPALRRFLVGPWTRVMTFAALREGAQSEAMTQLAFVVDDLIRATARPGRPVSVAQQRVLLRQVADALARAGEGPSRVKTEMDELLTVLRDPPPLQEESWEEVIDPVPAPVVLDLQAGLPTVPIQMGGDSTLDAAHQRDWLDTLEPGAYCRLFLMGRWLTAQLGWVSETRTLFLFSSRHGGRTHSLTRRMLAKLRNAGLATSIEDGFLLAQAMEALADAEMAPG